MSSNESMSVEELGKYERIMSSFAKSNFINPNTVYSIEDFVVVVVELYPLLNSELSLKSISWSILTFPNHIPAPPTPKKDLPTPNSPPGPAS